MIRGSTDNLMDDIERAIDDGVNTFKVLVRVCSGLFKAMFQNHLYTKMWSLFSIGGEFINNNNLKVLLNSLHANNRHANN